MPRRSAQKSNALTDGGRRASDQMRCYASAAGSGVALKSSCLRWLRKTISHDAVYIYDVPQKWSYVSDVITLASGTTLEAWHWASAVQAPCHVLEQTTLSTVDWFSHIYALMNAKVHGYLRLASFRWINFAPGSQLRVETTPRHNVSFRLMSRRSESNINTFITHRMYVDVRRPVGHRACGIKAAAEVGNAPQVTSQSDIQCALLAKKVLFTKRCHWCHVGRDETWLRRMWWVMWVTSGSRKVGKRERDLDFRERAVRLMSKAFCSSVVKKDEECI